MNTPSFAVKRLTQLFAWSSALVISVAVPTVYFFVSYQYLTGVLDAQAELKSKEISELVIANPTMWQFEEIRLSELLEKRSKDQTSELRIIRDTKGAQIASNSIDVAPPMLTRYHNIYDAGLVVAKIEFNRSLQPLLFETLFVAVCAILAAALLLIFLYKVPLALITTAYKAISDSETKYRSLYSSMKEGLALHTFQYDDLGLITSFVIIDANPACAAMFDNGSGTGLIGRNSIEAFGTIFQEYLPELRHALTSNEPATFEYFLPDKERYFSVQAFATGNNLIATLFEDITDRRKSEQQIQQMAYYDALTGLPNRILMMDRLSRALNRSERDHTAMAVMFLDLDRFKIINDTLGHSVGDKLLIEVASRLRSVLRSSDTLARLGGDEFVVIITDLDKEVNAAHVAQKLIDCLAAEFRLADQTLFITTSIGIALYPDDAVTAEVLLKNADMAMYSSKDGGRNSYNFYSADMNRKAHERLAMEENMRLALINNEFFLEFQPIVRAHDLTVVAAEALVRWQHPQLGRVAPDAFIPVAEDSGMILPLGEWVLRDACAMLKQLQHNGITDVRITVNVSSVQIERQDFAQLVRTVLEETGAPPAQLELELTESCLMKHSTASIQDVFSLQQLGITIAIDDFGTGYSSLAYIKNLPIDHIKIDRSFITDITDSPKNQAIVESIITMSEKLGIRNIAEGVETAEQLAFLQGRHCGEIQGFYFYRPLPRTQFEALVTQQRVT